MAVSYCVRAEATPGGVIPFLAGEAQFLAMQKSTTTSLAKFVVISVFLRQSGSNYSLKRTAASGCDKLQLFAAVAA